MVTQERVDEWPQGEYGDETPRERNRRVNSAMKEIVLAEDPTRIHYMLPEGTGSTSCPTCDYRHVMNPGGKSVSTIGLVWPKSYNPLEYHDIDVRRSYNGRNGPYVRRPPRDLRRGAEREDDEVAREEAQAEGRNRD